MFRGLNCPLLLAASCSIRSNEKKGGKDLIKIETQIQKSIHSPVCCGAVLSRELSGGGTLAAAEKAYGM